MMPWLDAGSIGHQFEQTLPFYDFYGSTTEIACSGTPRPDWIQYYDTDAQNNKITGTDLRVPEGYQNQQSPGFEHATNDHKVLRQRKRDLGFGLAQNTRKVA
ncbi:hypothetical protein J7T55_012233 [Diaporthe amygdali]|uniref:uncharacterized protein n=1 Tax=Phomopsis amygdali TaxID=1214568 RepID=UPI0022FEA598|nr:uncharacterized protein J7T55_012233 [Diaporthe amygdali]KAJ0123764.1 hypothetical protein J7T55_012233 [Diaporthe amygdali]